MFLLIIVATYVMLITFPNQFPRHLLSRHADRRCLTSEPALFELPTQQCARPCCRNCGPDSSRLLTCGRRYGL